MNLNISKIEEIAKNHTNDYKLGNEFGQYILTVPKEKIVDIANNLRDEAELKFDLLTDATAIDRLTKRNRFEVVYFLNSIQNKSILRLKTIVEEREPKSPTLCGVWESANWYERETFDMYGIIFEGHPDLRRFYMPEDLADPISGEPLYPLRKDFPMMGVKDSLPMPPFPERDEN